MNAKASFFKWFTVLSLTTTWAARGELCEGKAEFNIDSASGAPMVKKPEYVRHGRTFVEGRPDEAYSIHFKNNFPSRVLVVVSVDGLDVLEGKTANAESSGYVVEANKSLEIKGWRTSTAEVRQFFFDEKKNSYAAGTDHGTKNCGVIACKVFAEKPLVTTYAPPPPPAESEDLAIPPPRHNAPRASRSSPPAQSFDLVLPRLEEERADGDAGSRAELQRFRSASGGLALPRGAAANSTMLRGLPASSVPEFKLGTGWGAPVRDCVQEVTFERGQELTTMKIYYSDAESLERIGIALYPKPVTNPELPQAFAEFCPPPKSAR